MDVTVERDPLFRALSRLQGVVDKRHTMAILTNAVLTAEAGHLSIVGTDLEVSLEQRVPATVRAGGTAAVSARALFEIVRESAEDEVQLNSDDHALVVVYGSSRFRLMGVDPGEHPGMPEPGGEALAEIEIDAGDLAEMIRKTLFSVSTDDTRTNLTGVYLDRGSEDGQIRFVATDGHRLAMIDRPASGAAPAGGAILPRKGLAELGKLLADAVGNVRIVTSSSEAVATVGDARLSMRLVEGSFPDYQKVIPEKGGVRIEAERDALLGSLRRVSIVSSERIRGVRLRLREGTLEVSASNPDLGEASEEITVESEGGEIEVGFNARYLLDVLAVFPESSKVTVELGDELGPGLVRGEDPGYRYVVMPMRI
ncbi:MAG: DNA polymerase III subunit beta [Candidatus Dadabacteria bacterium]|nr:MAG: DNA polymerase III subunit beta [Candidatus Dadabacteria bacterium]